MGLLGPVATFETEVDVSFERSSPERSSTVPQPAAAAATAIVPHEVPEKVRRVYRY